MYKGTSILDIHVVMSTPEATLPSFKKFKVLYTPPPCREVY